MAYRTPTETNSYYTTREIGKALGLTDKEVLKIEKQAVRKILSLLEDLDIDVGDLLYYV